MPKLRKTLFGVLIIIGCVLLVMAGYNLNNYQGNKKEDNVRSQVESLVRDMKEGDSERSYERMSPDYRAVVTGEEFAAVVKDTSSIKGELGALDVYTGFDQYIVVAPFFSDDEKNVGSLVITVDDVEGRTEIVAITR